MQLRLSVAMVQCPPACTALQLIRNAHTSCEYTLSCQACGWPRILRRSAGTAHVWTNQSDAASRAEQITCPTSHTLSCAMRAYHGLHLRDKASPQACQIPGSAGSQMYAAGRPTDSALPPFALTWLSLTRASPEPRSPCPPEAAAPPSPRPAQPPWPPQRPARQRSRAAAAARARAAHAGDCGPATRAAAARRCAGCGRRQPHPRQRCAGLWRPVADYRAASARWQPPAPCGLEAGPLHRPRRRAAAALRIAGRRGCRPAAATWRHGSCQLRQLAAHVAALALNVGFKTAPASGAAYVPRLYAGQVRPPGSAAQHSSAPRLCATCEATRRAATCQLHYNWRQTWAARATRSQARTAAPRTAPGAPTAASPGPAGAAQTPLSACARGASLGIRP